MLRRGFISVLVLFADKNNTGVLFSAELNQEVGQRRLASNNNTLQYRCHYQLDPVRIIRQADQFRMLGPIDLPWVFRSSHYQRPHSTPASSSFTWSTLTRWHLRWPIVVGISRLCERLPFVRCDLRLVWSPHGQDVPCFLSLWLLSPSPFVRRTTDADFTTETWVAKKYPRAFPLPPPSRRRTS